MRGWSTIKKVKPFIRSTHRYLETSSESPFCKRTKCLVSKRNLTICVIYYIYIQTSKTNKMNRNCEFWYW